MFLDLGVKRKRGCTGISDPGYNFFLRRDSEGIREQTNVVIPSRADGEGSHEPVVDEAV
jgi:hypothetical protein